jgi:heme oxygenase
MDFFEELERSTADARARLQSSDVIVDCLNGRVSHESYVAFLTQAYHHVRHTVPLLMACGSRLPDRLGWLQKYVVDYIVDEQGHERWIASDIEAAGADAVTTLAAGSSAATETMVSYAYDTVYRRNPVGFFGMVYVLEGTSVALATRAADIIQRELALPDSAFSYLRSHGTVDQAHIATYQEIVNRLEDPDDRQAIVHSARIFFDLYADVFDDLPRAGEQPDDAQKRAVA